MASAARHEPTLVFDTFDVDLVIKVLKQTFFSPFFLFLIPAFFYFQGFSIYHPAVFFSGLYYLAVSAFWLFKFISRIYRNNGSIFFAPPPLDWGEQIVVVTGGSSGIGELLANTLAVRNVTVVVLDVKPIQTENYNITYYPCDVSKWEEVEAVSKKIAEEIGHPTVLINNAGVVQGKLILDLQPEEVKETFDVNVLAHYWTLKAFLPDMIKNKAGHIFTIGSVMGLVGSAQMSDYCASKAAIVALNESLRYELDNRYKTPDIRTTLVLPGHVQTQLFASASLPTSWFYRFFAPSLPPYAVAKAVIKALDERDSSTVRLPFYVNIVPFVPLLPSYLRDFVQYLSHADFVMSTFVKSPRSSSASSATPNEKAT